MSIATNIIRRIVPELEEEAATAFLRDAFSLQGPRRRQLLAGVTSRLKEGGSAAPAEQVQLWNRFFNAMDQVEQNIPDLVTNTPLPHLMQALDSELIRDTSTPKLLHPRVRATLDQFSTPPEPPKGLPFPTTEFAQGEALKQQRAELEVKLRQVFAGHLDDPELSARFPALQGGMGEEAARVSNALSIVGRILTDPLPDGPGTGAQVRQLAQSIHAELGLDMPFEQLEGIARKLGERRRVVSSESANRRVATVQRSIDKLQESLSTLDPSDHAAAARRLDRLQDIRESLLPAAVAERGIEERHVWTAAMVDAITQPLDNKMRRPANFLADLVLREQGHIGSPPDRTFVTTLDDLLTTGGYLKKEEAAGKVGRKLAASGTLQAGHIPADRFVDFQGTSGVFVKTTPFPTTGPKRGAIVQVKEGIESAFRAGTTDVPLPPGLTGADLIVVDSLAAKTKLPKADRAAIEAQLKEAKQLGDTARIATLTDQLVSVAGQRERTTPSLLVARADNPSIYFVVPSRALSTVRPPSKATSTLAERTLDTIAARVNPNVLESRALAAAGTAVTRPFDESIVYLLHQPNHSIVTSITEAPGTARNAQLTGTIVEAVTAPTRMAALQLARDRAVELTSQRLLAIENTRLRDRVLRGPELMQMATAMLADPATARSTVRPFAERLVRRASTRSVRTATDEARDLAMAAITEEAQKMSKQVAAAKGAAPEFPGLLSSMPADIKSIVNNTDHAARTIAKDYRLRDWKMQVEVQPITAGFRSERTIDTPVAVLRGTDYNGHPVTAFIDLATMSVRRPQRDAQVTAINAAYDRIEQALQQLGPTRGPCRLMDI